MNWRMIALATTLLVLGSLTGTMAASPPASDAPAASSAAAAGEVPILVVPQLQNQFEPVVEGTQITENFLVKNEGKGILEIQQVKTG